MNLCKCGEQFLNILHQNKVSDIVSRVAPSIFFALLLTNKNPEEGLIAYHYWAQSWGLVDQTGMLVSGFG